MKKLNHSFNHQPSLNYISKDTFSGFQNDRFGGVSVNYFHEINFLRYKCRKKALRLKLVFLLNFSASRSIKNNCYDK